MYTHDVYINKVLASWLCVECSFGCLVTTVPSIVLGNHFKSFRHTLTSDLNMSLFYRCWWCVETLIQVFNCGWFRDTFQFFTKNAKQVLDQVEVWTVTGPFILSDKVRHGFLTSSVCHSSHILSNNSMLTTCRSCKCANGSAPVLLHLISQRTLGWLCYEFAPDLYDIEVFTSTRVDW